MTRKKIKRQVRQDAPRKHRIQFSFSSLGASWRFNFFSDERAENLAALPQSLIRRRVGDAEIRVALGEDVAGDRQHVVLDRARAEIGRSNLIWNFRKNVKRAV